MILMVCGEMVVGEDVVAGGNVDVELMGVLAVIYNVERLDSGAFYSLPFKVSSIVFFARLVLSCFALKRAS